MVKRLLLLARPLPLDSESDSGLTLMQFGHYFLKKRVLTQSQGLSWERATHVGNGQSGLVSAGPIDI